MKCNKNPQLDFLESFAGESAQLDSCVVKKMESSDTDVKVFTADVPSMISVSDATNAYVLKHALSANDDDKLLLATMMEAALNTWSIGGDKVDNLFASIAILLMLTVTPVMIFNGWRMRREQKLID